MKDKLVSDIAVSPADVRRYFKDMPEDSIPLVPTEVEGQIITKSLIIELMGKYSNIILVQDGVIIDALR